MQSNTACVWSVMAWRSHLLLAAAKDLLDARAVQLVGRHVTEKLAHFPGAVYHGDTQIDSIPCSPYNIP